MSENIAPRRLFGAFSFARHEMFLESGQDFFGNCRINEQISLKNVSIVGRSGSGKSPP